MTEKTQKYINGYHDSVLKAHAWRTADNSCQHLLPTLKQMVSANPSLSLLDIGCGSGSITATLAQLMPQGQVTALDLSEDVLATAREQAKEKGVDNVTLATGDCYALKYPDASFDVVHAQQLLCHLDDPVRAIKEFMRVTKPGGVVALRECDVQAFAWYPQSEKLVRWHEILMKQEGAHHDAGRKLKSWCRAAGVKDAKLASTAGTWCYSTIDDRHAWGGSWMKRVTDSQYARDAKDKGLAKDEDLKDIAEAWVDWIQDDDAWFAVLNGEALIKV